jgi:hypothetical protein
MTQTADQTRVTNAALFAATLEDWDATLRILGAKAAAAFRALGEWLADRTPTGEEDEEGNPVFGLHEASHQRLALRKMVSTWASQVRGRQKRYLHSMPKNLGYVPNPDAEMDDGTTLAENVARKLFAKQKSVVHAEIKGASFLRVQLNKRDASGNPITPTPLDMTSLEGISDEENVRLNNVYATFIPSATTAAQIDEESIAEDFAF